MEAEGFELLEAPRARLVEQIKDAVIRLVHYREAAPSANLSRYLSELLHKDYSTLSKAFSEETGTTIERYAIVQKIERVKELLTYDELTLNEIADRLGYSSAAYLSTQFKQITGLTPSAFKRSEGSKRRAYLPPATSIPVHNNLSGAAANVTRFSRAMSSSVDVCPLTPQTVSRRQGVGLGTHFLV